MDNWSQLMLQDGISIKDMNNIIKDLHLEKDVSLINDEDENQNQNKWIQRNQFFDYCLEYWKKGQAVKSVGKIIPVDIMDKIIDACGLPNRGKSIRIQFLSCSQTAYETD